MKQEKTTQTFVFAFAGWNSNNPLSFQLQYLAQKLAELGNRIIVIVQGSGSTDVNWSDKNISVLFWPSKRPTKWRDAWFLAKIIKKNKPACVLANFAAVNWMMVVGRLFRVPVRIAWYQTLHKQITIDQQYDAVKTKLLVLRKKLVYRLATNVVPVSCFAFEELWNIYRVPQEKRKVIYNLLTDPLKSNFKKSNNNQVDIVCVARLDHSKGQDVLIKAMHLLVEKYPKLRLKLIGDGPRRYELVELSRSLQVSEKVDFMGRIPHEDVLKNVFTSYLNIHPARVDNCPLAVIESIALGTPLVASNTGGIPEIIRDGVDGFLVPPDSPEALANAIEKILESPELRDTLAKNARERFLSTFELTNGVQDIIAWLTATIDARS